MVAVTRLWLHRGRVMKPSQLICQGRIIWLQEETMMIARMTPICRR